MCLLLAYFTPKIQYFLQSQHLQFWRVSVEMSDPRHASPYPAQVGFSLEDHSTIDLCHEEFFFFPFEFSSFHNLFHYHDNTSAI
ncbi:hypothetical protein POPTR_015G025701v4 [Populus trichocarpa]|uniref:Uncharacterized protein n=1 Tax=Populus trichocarpa TaxID=3694 RepID=A0ACC0RVQ7_POPTR|nr:hypothetical protein POPTR_015G025701v4 [Populus trichocarpa]